VGVFRLGRLPRRRGRLRLVLIGRSRFGPRRRAEFVAALYFALAAALGQEIDVDRLARAYLNPARTPRGAAVLRPGSRAFVGVGGIRVQWRRYELTEWPRCTGWRTIEVAPGVRRDVNPDQGAVRTLAARWPGIEGGKTVPINSAARSAGSRMIRASVTIG